MDHLKQENQSTSKRVRHLISSPIIYSVIVPTIILDAFMEIYQQTCFRLYDLPINERAKYIKIDRHKLKYLNPLEKFNCMYCSYVNGVFEYSKKIAADSEKYWCGIQHQKSENYISPSHHKDFLEYGDKDSFMILREKQTAQISAEQKLPNEAK